MAARACRPAEHAPYTVAELCPHLHTHRSGSHQTHAQADSRNVHLGCLGAHLAGFRRGTRLGGHARSRPHWPPRSCATGTTTWRRARARSAAASATNAVRAVRRHATRPRRCSSSSSMLQPEFIAMHDIGTALVAPHAGRPGRGHAAGRCRSCMIRRQGYGMALATLEFVELPVADGQPLRLYTTEVDADTQQRQPPGAHAARPQPPGRGDGRRPAAARAGDGLAAAARRHHATAPGRTASCCCCRWPAAAALAGQASHLAGGTGVQVRTTPQVMRPADAWDYISGTWNQLRAQLRDTDARPALTPTPPARAVGRPAPPRPALRPRRRDGSLLDRPRHAGARRCRCSRCRPCAPRPRAAARRSTRRWPTYVRKCSELNGMVSCCVFELATQRTIGPRRRAPRPGRAGRARRGADGARWPRPPHALNLGDAAPDAAITLGSHHLLLRAVPGRPGLALHAVLDKQPRQPDAGAAAAAAPGPAARGRRRG